MVVAEFIVFAASGRSMPNQFDWSAASLRDVGEKTLIRDLVHPLLNPMSDEDSIGDDCAIVSVPPGFGVCASTDRVPADLVRFRLGILDHFGFGRYLAVLNLGDE
jgi:thiamine monophosphate kinase